MPSQGYSRQELFDDEGVRTFPETASELAFPLGGLGTGNVSLGARGQLTDWEIYGRPGKGNELPFSFFAIHCDSESVESTTRILEAAHSPPYTNWYGYPSQTVAGLPRVDESNFTGEYPIASVSFADEQLPLDVSLEAFTPFVPLDPERSGLPTAILQYTLANPTDEPVSASVVGSMSNPVGFTRPDARFPRQHLTDAGVGGNVNEYRDADGLDGIHYRSERYDPEAARYGDAALVVLDADEVTHKAAWRRDDHPWVECQDFWNDFSADGRLRPNEHDEPTREGNSDVGSIGARVQLAPGEERTVTFVLAWYFPNRPNEWDELEPIGEVCCSDDASCCDADSTDAGSASSGLASDSSDLIQNHYATRFDGAWDVAEHVAANFDSLKRDTERFRDAFFDSTLPGYVLEAVSSQMAVARSTTCVWLADGSFLGYEGCYPTAGCCEGTCTHVWNYAQTLAYLFPSLEREMRRIDFEESTDPETGKMDFRTAHPFGEDLGRRGIDQRPAADGQMGTIMRLYREWRISGDREYLERLWPTAKRALEFAFEQWDPDEDGVMEGVQHNTHDIQFEGPNSMVGTWYLGALRAGAEMARAVGEDDAADRYEALADRGGDELDVRLFNGEYYEQEIEDVNARKYQYGTGCLSDQVIGQWFARTVGLGDLLPREHVRSTLKSVHAYNFRTEFSDHENCQRTYALNDEAGLLTCTWPRGGRPEFPFRSDEVWTGIEYQVASHLIYEGMVEEGLEIVRAIRERHDGVRRNPWNEFECGNHYTRAMASWAVYTALTGLDVDLTDSGPDEEDVDPDFELDPALDDEQFSCFWITGDRWGTYERWTEDGETRERVETVFERG